MNDAPEQAPAVRTETVEEADLRCTICGLRACWTGSAPQDNGSSSSRTMPSNAPAGTSA
jgi:hypothetical protein